MDRFLFWRRYKISGYLIALFIFWLVYTGFSVMAPVSQTLARYGVTTAQGNLIRATVLVPSLIIWLASLFAVLRFYKYTSFLRGSAEGTAFKKISFGLLMLFLNLIIPGVINIVASYYPDSLVIQKTIVILRNYVSLVFYFTAFWNLYQGSTLLNKTIETDNKFRTVGLKALVIFMVGLTSAYVWAVFHNSHRTITENPLLVRPTYFLEDWLIVLTIVIPYLITWTVGGLAILNIRSFAMDVPGKIYRRSFNNITYGLLTIILLGIGLQLLTQAATVFADSSLKVILLLVYLIILIMAAGYLYLARGARQLTDIEEI